MSLNGTLRTALLVLVGLCALVVGSAPALADTYAVVAFEVSGDADPTLRDQVKAGLARGIAEVGGKVIAYDDVQAKLADKPALVGCLSTTCLASIAEIVGTEKMVRLRVAANGANYEVELELLGADGPVRRRSGTCTVCTVTDLADLTAARVNDLLTAAAGAPLPVEIVTRPAGATLVIPGAGEQIGPWSGGLAPGTHVIEARMPGYATATQEITVVDDGSEQRFEIALVSEGGHGPRRWGWIKYATGGAAAATVITGLVLIGLEGNRACDVPDATCPDEYATGTAGIVVTVVGLAGAGAAGWMYWSDRKLESRERVIGITPTRDGAMAWLHWRF